MRLKARLKLGFYPLAKAEAQRVRRFLSYSEGPSSVLDPCTGEGGAFQAITAESGTRRYGIELDAFRATDARRVLDEVIQGNAFDCHAPVESFSLLYLNPPYDFEVGEGKNQRMEKLFLEHCFRWLKPGGVLVMVIPFDRIQDCRAVLTPHFRDKAIYRLTEPESMKYRQAVLFGVRRTRQERDRLTDAAIHHAHLKLADLTRSYDSIPALPEQPDREFAVPPSPPARLENRGLPLDLIEDLLPNSPASLQARRITHADKIEFQGRPLTPLHKGHVGLLCTSGLLNGVFGEGEDRHVAFWEAVKVTDKTEEEGDAGETVIREKERFSQRLTLLYATGRFLMLSEKSSGKEAKDGERPPEAGQSDVCPADEG